MICMILKQKHQICNLLHEFKNVQDNARRESASKDKKHQAEVSSYVENLERLTQSMEISRMQEEIARSVLQPERKVCMEDLDCTNTKVAEIQLSTVNTKVTEIHNETVIDVRAESELQKGISLTQEPISSTINKAASLEMRWSDCHWRSIGCEESSGATRQIRSFSMSRKRYRSRIQSPIMTFCCWRHHLRS